LRGHLCNSTAFLFLRSIRTEVNRTINAGTGPVALTIPFSLVVTLRYIAVPVKHSMYNVDCLQRDMNVTFSTSTLCTDL